MQAQSGFLQPATRTRWRDRLLTAGGAIIVGMTLSNVVPADEASRESKRAADLKHDQSVQQAKADYKVARARCNELAGNQKDVCVKEAEAAKKSAMADAKAAKESASARAEANEDKRGAEFKVAKERCDAMSGNARDVCQEEARARYRH